MIPEGVMTTDFDHSSDWPRMFQESSLSLYNMKVWQRIPKTHASQVPRSASLKGKLRYQAEETHLSLHQAPSKMGNTTCLFTTPSQALSFNSSNDKRKKCPLRRTLLTFRGSFSDASPMLSLALYFRSFSRWSMVE